MKYSGKWRVHGCITADDELGLVYRTLGEMLEKDPSDENAAQMSAYVIEITDDGSIMTCMPIPDGTPAEAIEAAKAGGMEIVDDKFAVLGRTPWKEEDGVIKFDSGVRGETLGEPVDPWAPLEEDENGLLKYLVMKLERME